MVPKRLNFFDNKELFQREELIDKKSMTYIFKVLLLSFVFVSSPHSFASEDADENSFDHIARQQIQLAEELQTNSEDIAESIHLYIQALSSTDPEARQKARLGLAQLFESSQTDIDQLLLAKSFYSTLDKSTQIEADERIEQLEFDEFRRRQLNALNAQESLANPSGNTTVTTKVAENIPFNWWLVVSAVFFTLSITLIAKLVSIRKHSAAVDVAHTKESASNHAEIIKKQQRQLKKLFAEIQRLQKQANKDNVSPTPLTKHKASSLEIACAQFGYRPDSLPNQDSIKKRYKQLGKIYHPDVAGTSEEMQRLNQALRIILDFKNLNK